MRPVPPAASRDSLKPLPEEYVSSISGAIIRPYAAGPPHEPVADRRPEPVEGLAEILFLRTRMRVAGYELRPLSFDLDNLEQQAAEYNWVLRNGNGHSTLEFMRQNHDRDFKTPPLDGPWVGGDPQFDDPDPGDADR